MKGWRLAFVFPAGDEGGAVKGSLLSLMTPNTWSLGLLER